MSRPQNSFQTQPQNESIRAPKVKNDTNIKANARIEGNIENESCSTTWVDPKTVVKPYSNPKPA